CLHVSALNMPSLLSLPITHCIPAYSFLLTLCTPNCLHLAILLCIRRIAILTHIFQSMHSSLFFFFSFPVMTCDIAMCKQHLRFVYIFQLTDQYLSWTHVGPHFDQDLAIWCHHEG
ncbi:hypothetical protein EDC96DRAFT_528381, partial [Choanephora cucurbitarum]